MSDELEYSTEGIHILVDLWGARKEDLDDLNLLQNIMKTGIIKSGATIVSVQSKQFQPNGVTILILLEESHYSIHTYPDRGFAAVDCFTCGSINPQVAIDILVDELQPKKIYERFLKRGNEQNGITVLNGVSNES